MSEYVYLENEITQELTRRGYKAAKMAFWIGLVVGFVFGCGITAMACLLFVG